MQDNGSSANTEESPSTSKKESPVTLTNTRPTSPNSSVDGTQIWNWKPAEEDLLVSIRHEKNDMFLKSKNHTALWKEISNQLNEILQCCVSPTQAMNKYYSLKKKWKEVIDAGTGSDRKYFRQKDQFDELYGCKESTKPSVVMDTLVNAAERTENKQKRVNEIKKKSLKRKSDSILEVLEKHNKEMVDKMDSMHQEKMQKFDRLLNLYETELKSRSGN